MKFFFDGIFPKYHFSNRKKKSRFARLTKCKWRRSRPCPRELNCPVKSKFCYESFGWCLTVSVCASAVLETLLSGIAERCYVNIIKYLKVPWLLRKHGVRHRPFCRPLIERKYCPMQELSLMKTFNSVLRIKVRRNGR